MRIWVIIAAATLIMTGCAHWKIQKTNDALKTVASGESTETVLQRLGPPDLRHDIGENRMVLFYQTHATPSDTPIEERYCTAVAFENNRVVAVGDDPTERWMREETERIRLADQERQKKATATAAQAQAEKERQRKIDELEAAVRPVPPTHAAQNLKLYRQLLTLDPQNERYRKKVAVYEQRLSQQKRQHQAGLPKAVQEKTTVSTETAFEARNKRLRHYTGNGIAEIAVHDLGGGSLYVWVKNISQQVITTYPDHFTLKDIKGRPMACKVNSSLDSVLEPGNISHGKITFDKNVTPGVLIFINKEAGQIVKSLK